MNDLPLGPEDYSVFVIISVFKWSVAIYFVIWALKGAGQFAEIFNPRKEL